MTAEIGMLNKYAVALAADSAVTVTSGTGKKVYNSANKLFKLSKFEPIGIMVYGDASFLSIPWETIIKLYRKQLSNNSFRTVNDYGNDFIEYLKSFTVPKENIDKFIEHSLLNFIDLFFQSGKILTEWVEEYTTFIQSQNNIHNIKEDDYKEFLEHRTKDIMDYFIEKQSEELYQDKIDCINEDIAKKFFELCMTALSSDRDYSASGIVIAGFGIEEIYPSICSYNIEGKIGNTLIYKNKENTGISIDNNALIIPFAQTNMIDTFISGINPELENNYQYEILKNMTDFASDLTRNLSDKLGIEEQATKELEKELIENAENLFFNNIHNFLSKYKTNKHIIPIINTVALLEKNDLAHMAESLVNIASMDKQMTIQLESVGGPIDVAIISKGDGFIWYKRKHYFKPELNPEFIARKELGC